MTINQYCYILYKKGGYFSLKTFKYIDLFAGMGGMRIGLEQTLKEKGIKGECVLTSEIKPFALQAYKDNFEDKNIVGDITKIKSSSIPDFDMLLAGFPCQPFSSAGKQLGFEDTRGTLFFEIARILKDKQPKYFLLENKLLNSERIQTRFRRQATSLFRIFLLHTSASHL